MGLPYLLEGIVAAVEARKQDESYRIYMTDCLYYIGRHLGISMQYRYFDILYPQPEEKRSGKEIALERLERFGIKVVE